ncbi:MAG: Ig-like domain-containing protein, partial [Treponemataceae bacterium]|nr:Ig-like domain-containing protein [Treponemataceae bacterium]
MKKLNRFAALAAIILLLVMGCKVEPDAIAVESVSLSETTLTIELGKTRRLTATVTPDNADDKTVKWSSSNSNFALVDSNGMIAAVKEGTAIITAQAGDKMAMCIVTVKSAVAVESIRLSETTLTLTPAMTKRLTATVTPYNADDPTVTWSSSDDDIATVDNYGIVRAYAEGTATITAQAGDKTATCTVTVHSHSYSEGNGAVQDFNGTIDENGVLTNYWGNESSVAIPDSVTSIGNYAFYGCTSLTSVTIPDSV